MEMGCKYLKNNQDKNTGLRRTMKMKSALIKLKG